MKDWTEEIAELEKFFSSASIPEQIRFNDCSMILDTSKFIENHLLVLKSNNGKRSYFQFLTRLKELKKILLVYEDK